MKVKHICEGCKIEFELEKREFNRGQKYCSKKCFYNNRKKSVKIPNCSCGNCGKEFYRNNSKQKISKSGVQFCSRACKDQAQRIGGIKEIQPSHYKNGEFYYRNKAFRLLPNKCNHCGFNQIIEVLQVHHKDRNRLNNDINNLEILCPTCHQIEHFNAKDGIWSKAVHA